MLDKKNDTFTDDPTSRNQQLLQELKQEQEQRILLEIQHTKLVEGQHKNIEYLEARLHQLMQLQTTPPSRSIVMSKRNSLLLEPTNNALDPGGDDITGALDEPLHAPRKSVFNEVLQESPGRQKPQLHNNSIQHHQPLNQESQPTTPKQATPLQPRPGSPIISRRSNFGQNRVKMQMQQQSNFEAHQPPRLDDANFESETQALIAKAKQESRSTPRKLGIIRSDANSPHNSHMSERSIHTAQQHHQQQHREQEQQQQKFYSHQHSNLVPGHPVQTQNFQENSTSSNARGSARSSNGLAGPGTVTVSVSTTRSSSQGSYRDEGSRYSNYGGRPRLSEPEKTKIVEEIDEENTTLFEQYRHSLSKDETHPSRPNVVTQSDRTVQSSTNGRDDADAVTMSFVDAVARATERRANSTSHNSNAGSGPSLIAMVRGDSTHTQEKQNTADMSSRSMSALSNKTNTGTNKEHSKSQLRADDDYRESISKAHHMINQFMEALGTPRTSHSVSVVRHSTGSTRETSNKTMHVEKETITRSDDSSVVVELSPSPAGNESSPTPATPLVEDRSTLPHQHQSYGEGGVNDRALKQDTAAPSSNTTAMTSANRAERMIQKFMEAFVPPSSASLTPAKKNASPTASGPATSTGVEKREEIQTGTSTAPTSRSSSSGSQRLSSLATDTNTKAVTQLSVSKNDRRRRDTPPPTVNTATHSILKRYGVDFVTATSSRPGNGGVNHVNSNSIRKGTKVDTLHSSSTPPPWAKRRASTKP